MVLPNGSVLREVGEGGNPKGCTSQFVDLLKVSELLLLPHNYSNVQSIVFGQLRHKPSGAYLFIYYFSFKLMNVTTDIS